MPNVVLASGPITNTDNLVVELVIPPDAPTTIVIRWPGHAAPSVCPPSRFPAAALAVIAVLDDALQEFNRMPDHGHRTYRP
jgi:hypothetical protein